MTVNVRYYGSIKKAMPKHLQGTHKVHATTYKEILSYTEQLYPLREHLSKGAIDVLVGKNLTDARPLRAEQVARGSLLNGATVHIRPNANGAITGAVLVTALIDAAIAIGVSILASLLFPSPTNASDTRKNALYQSGLQTTKEGIPLAYVAGDTVFCGGNVIEGDYDYSASGGSSVYAGYDGASAIGIGVGLLKTGGYASAVPTDSSQVQTGITSFKGKGGGKTISNSTFSDATIRFAMAYGAGETGGIKGSNGTEKSKNILINEVPLVDPGTGTPNYYGISWEERFGVPGQAALKLTPGTSSPFTVDVDLTQGVTVPVTEQVDDGHGGTVTVVLEPAGAQKYTNEVVSDKDVNRVKLDFRINQLVYTSSKGNQSKTTVQFAADVKRQSSASWINAGNWTVYEKSSQAFDRQYTISAPPVVTGDDDPWEFRVYRITPDSTDDHLQNSTTFKGWVEIKDKDYTYDGSEGVGNVPTALFAAAIDLSSFDIDSKPEVAIIVEGAKVRVPDNYNTVARTYSGAWDGGWKYAVTPNPVWHWLEMATNTAMGCGYPDDFFDKFSLYQTAQRCDEIINGRYRYTLNKQFTDAKDGWQNLIDVAQTFRAYPYFNGSQIVLWQDRPGTPDHFINNSAVEDGKFTYTGVEGKDQINECIVQWDNPNDYYRVASVKYQDTDAIAANRKNKISNNGIITKTIYKIGCTNEQEAYDWAKAMVFDAQNQNFNISFTTSINACGYAPGQRILVDDWNISGKEMTGRITSVGSGKITIDNPITQKSGVSYDALLVVNNVLSRRSLAQVSTTTKTATFSLDTSEIAPFTPISIVENTATAAQPLEYTISSITENDQGKYQVTALRYIEGKHAFIDNGTPVTSVPWSQVQVVTPTPQNMVFSTYSYIDDILGPRHGIDIAWDKVASDPTGSNQGLALGGYTVEVQVPNSSTWTQIYKGTDNFTNMTNCDPGTYTFSLRSISILGKSSAANVEQYTMGNNASAALTAPVFDGAN